MSAGDIYVVNGFYAAMQADYVEPGASIYYYSVEWNAASLSWEEFRSSVLDPTNDALKKARATPRQCHAHSLPAGRAPPARTDACGS